MRDQFELVGPERRVGDWQPGARWELDDVEWLLQ